MLQAHLCEPVGMAETHRLRHRDNPATAASTVYNISIVAFKSVWALLYYVVIEICVICAWLRWLMSALKIHNKRVGDTVFISETVSLRAFTYHQPITFRF